MAMLGVTGETRSAERVGEADMAGGFLGAATVTGGIYGHGERGLARRRSRRRTALVLVVLPATVVAERQADEAGRAVDGEGAISERH